MFKVVDGAVKVVESAFANQNREDGVVLEDIALKVPDSKNSLKIDSNGHVPLNRAFPTAGFM
jgi:hypothetical protein